MTMTLDDRTTTMTVTRPSMAASVGMLCARIPIGAFFIVASAMKLKEGVNEFTKSMLPTAQKVLPNQFAEMYLHALPWAELTVGILVIIGLLTRVSAGVMVLLLASFTIVYFYPGGLPKPPGPFHYNFVYLGTALAIMLVGPGWLSLDGLIFRPRRRLVVTEEINQRPPGL
jgi:uncharacterized membrane protein YphA (DoxX/SURF4 family)